MSKQEADDLLKLEIWWLKEHGYLTGWKSGGITWKYGLMGNESSISIEVTTFEHNMGIRFQYSITPNGGEKKSFDYRFPLVVTRCNYGGFRYWFICGLTTNGQYCGRRVAVLYKGNDYFGCRHCYNLTYNSRNLSGFSKKAGQVISIPELEKLEN